MKKISNIIYLLPLISLLSLTLPSPIAAAETTKEKLSTKESWQNWVNKYDKGRRSENGWLSLVGLYWLKEGNNTLGSAKGNQHRFPAAMPATFGELTITGDKIQFTRKAKDILIDKKDIESSTLIVNETTVSLGSYSFYVIKREKGFAIRLKDSKSPHLAKYDGAHFYPYSKNWSVPARLIKNETAKKINIATVYGTVRENDSAGILEFTVNGKTLRLEAVSYGPEEPMALMFADETSQETTYGAGRFLDVDWPKDGDKTTINFNYAYNPPCAITEFATCPLPPRQNRLDVGVEAGELFSGH